MYVNVRKMQIERRENGNGKFYWDFAFWFTKGGAIKHAARHIGFHGEYLDKLGKKVLYPDLEYAVPSENGWTSKWSVTQDEDYEARYNATYERPIRFTLSDTQVDLLINEFQLCPNEIAFQDGIMRYVEFYSDSIRYVDASSDRSEVTYLNVPRQVYRRQLARTLKTEIVGPILDLGEEIMTLWRKRFRALSQIVYQDSYEGQPVKPLILDNFDKPGLKDAVQSLVRIGRNNSMGNLVLVNVRRDGRAEPPDFYFWIEVYKETGYLKKFGKYWEKVGMIMNGGIIWHERSERYSVHT